MDAMYSIHVLYLIGILRICVDLLVTKSIQLLRLNKARRSSGHKKTAWIWVHWSQVTNSIMILTMIDIIVNGGRVIEEGGLVVMFQHKLTQHQCLSISYTS